MELITPQITYHLKNLHVPELAKGNYPKVANELGNLVEILYQSIPEKKRISFGRVYIVKTITRVFYEELVNSGIPVFEHALKLYAEGKDYRSRGIALGIATSYAESEFDSEIFDFFTLAGNDPDWDVREMTQMFFRKMIKKYPESAHKYLLTIVKLPQANLRRFVAETLRPVQENKWMYKNPEYSLSILRQLFREKAIYPRTAVGNNLSDLSRHLPGLVFELVDELVAMKEKNAYWIAYRACRNLVKKDPVRVMKLLKVEKYKYKDRNYSSDDLQ